MADREYPFVLSTAAGCTSTARPARPLDPGGINELYREETADISPVDAAELGIGDGDLVRVSSRRGEVRVHARVTDEVPPGLVWMSFHFQERQLELADQRRLRPRDPDGRVQGLRRAGHESLKAGRRTGRGQSVRVGRYTFEEYCEVCKGFHGAAAPGVLVGGLLVDLARRSLPVGTLFEAICETRACLPDAIQLLTPCTTGNGRLRIVNVGRFALTLYDKYHRPRDARPSGCEPNWTGYPEVKSWFLNQAEVRAGLRRPREPDSRGGLEHSRPE